MSTPITYTEHRINSSHTAAVSAQTQWIPIDSNTPRGVKIQLISKKYGVAQYGVLSARNDFYTHWFPLPTFSS